MTPEQEAALRQLKAAKGGAYIAPSDALDDLNKREETKALFEGVKRADARRKISEFFSALNRTQAAAPRVSRASVLEALKSKPEQTVEELAAALGGSAQEVSSVLADHSKLFSYIIDVEDDSAERWFLAPPPPARASTPQPARAPPPPPAQDSDSDDDNDDDPEPPAPPPVSSVDSRTVLQLPAGLPADPLATILSGPDRPDLYTRFRSHDDRWVLWLRTLCAKYQNAVMPSPAAVGQGRQRAGVPIFYEKTQRATKPRLSSRFVGVAKPGDPPALPAPYRTTNSKGKTINYAPRKGMELFMDPGSPTMPAGLYGFEAMKADMATPPSRFIVHVLSIRCKSNGYHANALVYDSNTRTLYRFEPHGKTSPSYTPSALDAAIRASLPAGVSYSNAEQTSARLQVGPQAFEGYHTLTIPTTLVHGKVVRAETGGYCGAWVMLFINYCLALPALPPPTAALYLNQGNANTMRARIRAYAAYIVQNQPTYRAGRLGVS